jgi:HSP20 family protein
MIDQSVARSLDNYFAEKTFDINLQDKGRFYEADTSLAGIDPKNVKVSFADGLLTVSGEKKVDSVSPDGTQRSSRYEYVSKTISVPDTNKPVMAKSMNGRLTVTIPK